MNKYLLDLLLSILLVGMLVSGISCSYSSIAASGTDFPNTFTLTGALYTPEGSPAGYTEVLMLSADFNPVDDAPGSQVSGMDTTDAAGAFSITVSKPGMYVVSAKDLSQKLGVLVGPVSLVKQTTALSAKRLQKTGQVAVILPDTVDTMQGYVYLPGTRFFCSLTKGKTVASGKFQVMLDSIPVTELTRVSYGVTQMGSVDYVRSYGMETAIPTSTGTTTVNTISDPNIKPLWLFRVLVCVTDSTMMHYGGRDSLGVVLDLHFKLINRKFNRQGNFKGVFDFRIDSLYIIETNPLNELVAAPSARFDYRIVFDAFPTSEPGNYFSGARTIYQNWPASSGEGLFGKAAAGNATWLFALARGGIPLRYLCVDAVNNPINRQKYYVNSSFMLNPTSDSTWDTYSSNILNYHAQKVLTDAGIAHRAFPDTFGITVKNSAGTGVAGAAVALYGVSWYLKKIDTVLALSGKTDSKGFFGFRSNPYKPDALSSTMKYTNFLVQAKTTLDTGYAWMPVNDVGNAWFKKQDTVFTITVIVANKNKP